MDTGIKSKVKKTLTTRVLSEEQAEAIQRTPLSQKSVMVKAFSGKSKAAALKAKCLECAGFVRAEVAECTVECCPLWPYRPYQAKQGAKEQ